MFELLLLNVLSGLLILNYVLLLLTISTENGEGDFLKSDSLR